MVKDKDQILRTIERNSESIKRLGVRRLALFGSCSRDRATESSDLDFVVEFEKKTFDAYMDLKDLLERLFDCPVDLVLSDAIKPRLRAAIMESALYAPGF